MKCQFNFMGRKYLSPTKKEARKFIAFYQPNFCQIFRIKTSWRLRHIERAPGWVPMPVDLEDKIEYGK